LPQVDFDSKHISYINLQGFCKQLLVAIGLREGDADIVAESLVQANLRGIDSHGVARLPHYVDRIRQGSINAQPNIRTERLGLAVSKVNGNHGLGQLVMHQATREAISLAGDAGAGWVSVCDSSHCGALAYYGLQIARAGMIGWVFSHVESLVFPYGSRKPFAGTNPICLTAPGEGDQAWCLDMATSKVPWNAVINAAMEGVPIPDGWAVDETGTDTTIPSNVEALYPFGGYKGSGLGLMIDVLCSLLSGAPYGPDISPMYGDLNKRRLLGGLVGAIDIQHFVPLETFRKRSSEMIRRLNNLAPVKGTKVVLYPGQPELINYENRLQEGVPVGLNLIQILDAMAKDFGIETLLSELIDE